MKQFRHFALIAAVGLIAYSTASGAGDFRETMGQDCGGDDPRSKAVCDCVFDQMEANLGEEQLERIAQMREQQEAGESESKMESDAMQELMVIAAQLEEIDFMQCAAAAQP